MTMSADSSVIEALKVTIGADLASLKASLGTAVRDSIRAGQQAGEQFGEGFKVGSDGKLRDAKGRYVKTGQELADALGQGLGTGKPFKALEASLTDLRNEMKAGLLPAGQFREALARQREELAGTVSITQRGTDAYNAYVRQLADVRGELARLDATQDRVNDNHAQATTGTAGLGAQFMTLRAGIAAAAAAAAAWAGNEMLQQMIGLANEANKADTAVKVFNLTLNRFNVSAESATDMSKRLAERFGLSAASVQESMTTLIRAGFRDMGQLEKVMTGAAASAIAFGRDARTGFESLGDAAVTGLSAALNSIGIAENIGPVLADMTKKLGRELTEVERAGVLTNLVIKATATEVEALDTILNDFVMGQAEAKNTAAELRKELGRDLMPAVTALTGEYGRGLTAALEWARANRGELKDSIGAVAVAVTHAWGAIEVLIGFVKDLGTAAGGTISILGGLAASVTGGLMGALSATIKEINSVFQAGIEGLKAFQTAFDQLKMGNFAGAWETIAKAQERVVNALKAMPANIGNGQRQGAAFGLGLTQEGLNDLSSFGSATNAATASADARNTRVQNATDGFIQGQELIEALGLLGKTRGAAYGSTYSFKKKDGKVYQGTHYGEDIFAPRGTPIMAPVTGTLTLGEDAANGKWFQIVDALGNRIKGLHLDAFEKGLYDAVKAAGSKGLLIQAGTRIGGVGDTGNLSEGNHLHLAVYDALGKILNPLTAKLKNVETGDVWQGPRGTPGGATPPPGDDKETALEKEQRIRAEQIATEKLTEALRNASKARLETIIAGGVQKEGDLQRINLAEKELERRGQLSERAAAQAKAAREREAKEAEREAEKAAQEAKRLAAEQERVRKQLEADLRAGRVREAELTAAKLQELNRQELTAFKGTAAERLALVKRQSQAEFDAAEQVARIRRNNAIKDAELGPKELRQQKTDTANLEYQNTVLKLRGDRLNAVRAAQEGVTRAQEEAARKAREAISEQAKLDQQAYRDRRDSAIASIQNLSTAGLNALYDEARANRDQALLKAFYDEVDRRTEVAQREAAEVWDTLRQAAEAAGLTMDHLNSPPDWMRDTLGKTNRTPLRDLIGSPEALTALAASGDFPDLPGMLLSTYSGGDWAQLGTDFLQGLVEGLSGNPAWDAVVAVIRGELDLKEEITSLVNGAAVDVGNGFRTGNERPAEDPLGPMPNTMQTVIDGLRGMDDAALAAQLSFAQLHKVTELENAVLAEMKRRADAVTAALNEQRNFDAAVQLQTWTESLQNLTDAQLEDELQTAVAGRNLTEYNAIRAEQKRRVDAAAKSEQDAADAAAQTAKTFEALKARVDAIGQTQRPYADLISDLEKLKLETGANVAEIDKLLNKLRELQGREEGLNKFNTYAGYVRDLAGAFGKLASAAGASDLGANLSGIANLAGQVMNIAGQLASQNYVGAIVSIVSGIADMIAGFQKANAEVAKLRKDFAESNPFLNPEDYQKAFTRSRGFFGDLFGGGPEVVNEIDAIGLKFAQGMAGAFSDGLSRGLRAWMDSGDVNDFRKTLYGSVFDATFTGLVEAFKTEVLKDILAPAMKMWTDALKTPGQDDDAAAINAVRDAAKAAVAAGEAWGAQILPLLDDLRGSMGLDTGGTGSGGMNGNLFGNAPSVQLGIPRIEVTIPGWDMQAIQTWNATMPVWERSVAKFEALLDRALGRGSVPASTGYSTLAF